MSVKLFSKNKPFSLEVNEKNITKETFNNYKVFEYFVKEGESDILREVKKNEFFKR